MKSTIYTARDARSEKVIADERAEPREMSKTGRALVRGSEREVARNVRLLDSAITMNLGDATISLYRADLARAEEHHARLIANLNRAVTV